MRPNLFANVPARDYMQFGEGASFDAKAVAEVLGLKKHEVSKIAQVAPSSVRWDDAIPSKVRDRLEEIGSVINLVAGVFDGDAVKTALWFKAVNPLLGDVAPRDMIRLGRYDKLRKFIVSAIAEQARTLPSGSPSTGA
ncbi:hypothetical protein [Arenimonas sp. SCN 70-307]|uniref:hypothetical protein n=1 Tax=Arenimonas sp. SCN 70-307 TaxID=1660089 RepID=UPI0025C3CE4B|nr:hypothetical protein [Arenimonas sp. SCN 70-307]